jgi:hypothetical protein
MRRFCLVCASFAILPAIGGPAATVELQPGLWELTIKAERDNITTARPTKMRCITPEQAKAVAGRTSFELDSGAAIALRSRGGGQTCRVVHSQRTGDVLTWRMRCDAPISAEQVGRFTIEGSQHYTIVVETKATVAHRSVTSTLTTEGRHTGECPR